MSYSFSVSAATKAEAAEKVAKEFDGVVTGQSSHAADRDAALAAASAFLEVIENPGEGQRVCVSVSGSLSWQTENKFTSASINVSAWLERAT